MLPEPCFSKSSLGLKPLDPHTTEMEFPFAKKLSIYVFSCQKEKDSVFTNHNQDLWSRKPHHLGDTPPPPLCVLTRIRSQLGSLFSKYKKEYHAYVQAKTAQSCGSDSLTGKSQYAD